MTLPRAHGPRRARRVAGVTGACLAGVLALSALPSTAMSTATYEEVACLPHTDCDTLPMTGNSDQITVKGRGGTMPAKLAGALNQPPIGPVCPGFTPGASDYVQVGFTNPTKGSSWTKFVTFLSSWALAEPTALALVDRDLVCFETSYRFFVRPGFKLSGGPKTGRPYSGVLPSCAKVDKLFPAQYRAKLPALPCVLSTEVTQDGAGYYLKVVARIPPDETSSRVRHNSAGAIR